MCYFSGGSRENFRTDDALFPRDVFGGTLNFGTGDTFRYGESLMEREILRR